MKAPLFPFQEGAVRELRYYLAESLGGYQRAREAGFSQPQVVSFTAPTGSGKTVMATALIERILFGDDLYEPAPDAVVVWLSDSPELNEQSRKKILDKSDRISANQLVTLSDESFDRETFEDGVIYFLNTQKLSKSANLTQHGDARTYTIWDTLRNTVEEKSDRLYFIIDEAHRGMRGREAGRATSIMQKFIKGSEEDGIPPMPVVLGMSATIERFRALAGETSSTVRSCAVPVADVKSSGLLKDYLMVTYPGDGIFNTEGAVLDAAADNYKQKWEHWTQYCKQNHYAYVNPVFLVQVQNGTGGALSDTDLSAALARIESRIGWKFDAGQVVHAFDSKTSVTINGLEVPYEEPSRINDNAAVRVVFFKDALSTGWDCPRAETMMSYRRAVDATYIAQVMGRMVRTPMQRRVDTDEVLNNAHMFLPYFDRSAVRDVIDAFKSEGAPLDVIDTKEDETTIGTIHTKGKRGVGVPGQATLDFEGDGTAGGTQSGEMQGMGGAENASSGSGATTASGPEPEPPEPTIGGVQTEGAEAGEQRAAEAEAPSPGYAAPLSGHPALDAGPHDAGGGGATPSAGTGGAAPPASGGIAARASALNREEVWRAINGAGLLTYDIRIVRINDYLKSLFEMAHLLTQNNIAPGAADGVNDAIAKRIRDYRERLVRDGRYEALCDKARTTRLLTEIYNAFGDVIKENGQIFLFTDANLDAQLRTADAKMCREGVWQYYVKKTAKSGDDITQCKIDVILFAADKDEMDALQDWAKSVFHAMDDRYRRTIAALPEEKIRESYNKTVANGDKVSKHVFRLPETIEMKRDVDGKEYTDHLYADEKSGTAKIALNSWEALVIEEEEAREGFVCWLRNVPRRAWALCIPYEMGGVTKPSYPDFIIVRRDRAGYIFDVLEPHNPTLDDNLPKAKGFARYAKENRDALGRIELIRREKDGRFLRLDMNKTEICEKVLGATVQSELDALFDTYGTAG